MKLSSYLRTSILVALLLNLSVVEAIAATPVLGKPCPNSQFLKTVKVGSTYLICVEGNNGNIIWTKTAPPPKWSSAYYTKGFNEITNANTAFFVTTDFVAFLNSKNKMTSANALNWCNRVIRIVRARSDAIDSWTSGQIGDWISGCQAAALLIKP